MVSQLEGVEHTLRSVASADSRDRSLSRRLDSPALQCWVHGEREGDTTVGAEPTQSVKLALSPGSGVLHVHACCLRVTAPPPCLCPRHHHGVCDTGSLMHRPHLSRSLFNLTLLDDPESGGRDCVFTSRVELDGAWTAFPLSGSE